MQGDAKVVEVLNDVLTAELTAINQYFIHAKMCGNWGYERLAEYIRHESIDEMKHAAVKRFNAGVAVCVAASDNASRGAHRLA